MRRARHCARPGVLRRLQVGIESRARCPAPEKPERFHLQDAGGEDSSNRHTGNIRVDDGAQ